MQPWLCLWSMCSWSCTSHKLWHSEASMWIFPPPHSAVGVESESHFIRRDTNNNSWYWPQTSWPHFYLGSTHIQTCVHTHTHTSKTCSPECSCKLQDGLFVNISSSQNLSELLLVRVDIFVLFLFARPVLHPISHKHNSSGQNHLFSVLKNKAESAFVRSVQLNFPLFNYKYNPNIFSAPVS